MLAVSAGPKQPKHPRPTAGHRAPHPVRVTGPRHGVPRLTSRQTVPRPLHSWHTECPGITGRRPARVAVITSSSWWRSIGQPCSSKSTSTWAAMGVEVSSERDVLGMGVDGPGVLARGGEVAQSLDPPGGGARPDRDQQARVGPDLLDPSGVGRCRDRALDQGHVVGPRHRGPRHLGEVGDADGVGQGQQLVLAVEQAQLAAVAGRELPHGQGGTSVRVLCRPRLVVARGPRSRRVAHRSRSVSRWATTPA